MRTERLNFTGAKGRLWCGWLEVPVQSPIGYAVFAHCFGRARDSLSAVGVARALAGEGIAVLHFDFASRDGAGAEIAEPDVADVVGDIVAAAMALDDQGRTASLLIGHGLAGAAVLDAASTLGAVRAVVILAAPPGPAETENLLLRTSAARPGRQASCAGPEEGVIANLQAARIEALAKPLLVLHSPADAVVPLASAMAIFNAARHPKSFVSLGRADHPRSCPEDVAYAASVIAAWSIRNLAVSLPERNDLQPGAVLVEETKFGAFQVEVFAGGARLIADEPPELGGLGSGPTPYDLLCAGLGACSVMTIRLDSKRRNWPLECVRVSVGRTRGATPNDRELFTRVIELEGPLDDGQRERLLRTAARCPVSLTLSRGAEIRTELGVAGAGRGGPAGEHGRDLERCLT